MLFGVVEGIVTLIKYRPNLALLSEANLPIIWMKLRERQVLAIGCIAGVTYATMATEDLTT